MDVPTEYVAFPSRKDRGIFVARRFEKYLRQSILDVGCYEAPLRELLRAASYTGVDMAGNPDIELNLEKVERLPFEDNSFDTVICVDVLEHLDNLHSVFADLVRVSKQYIIVSLPNCWRDARCPIERGRGGFGHYGLPAEKPLDRHKWFFSLTQARKFIEAKAKEFGLEAEEMIVAEQPKNILVRGLRRIRYGKKSYQNRYAQTLWTVLRKTRKVGGNG